MTQFRVVETDNYDGDYPDESFVGPLFPSKEAAQEVADAINKHCASKRFWKVKPSDYQLMPGFEP